MKKQVIRRIAYDYSIILVVVLGGFVVPWSSRQVLCSLTFWQGSYS